MRTGRRQIMIEPGKRPYSCPMWTRHLSMLAALVRRIRDRASGEA